MHPGGRHGRRRARHGQAIRRVDYGNGVAGAGGGGLVKLHAGLVGLVGRGHKGGRRRVEGEGGDLLGVLRGRRVGGVAGERRAVRRGAADGNELREGRSVSLIGLQGVFFTWCQCGSSG